MKIILVFSVCFITSLSQAQTAIIAHKSHAGTALDFSIDPSTNFGDPPMEFPIQLPFVTNTFKSFNDSVMVLEILDQKGQIIHTDTLANKQRHSLVLFQALYQDSIEKENLRIRRMELDREEEQIKKQQLESQKQLNESAPAKKKKKSYLLFLFGITGGGMLLMKLFRRSKNIKPSIA